MAQWSQELAEDAQVLDLGCGTGVPISQVLIKRGFHVYGVDASPTMIAAFQALFPNVPVQCCAVEDSNFFGKTFDGVVAWGLFFLIDVEGQRNLIRKISGVLRSGGKLLFTAPSQSCSWLDGMTGRQSLSLGFNAYQKMLRDEALSLVETRSDEGENHYYLAQKF